MNTNTDISGQLKNYIDIADGLTASNILELLEVKSGSLWFYDESTADVSDDINLFRNDEKQLTFEQVKQMYPDWFNE